MSQIVFTPIGRIHSPHQEPEKTPVQPCFAADCPGQVEVFSEYTEGLADIEGYSHISLLFLLHRAGEVRLKVRPFLQDAEHGVFATRAPFRPNPIGLSVVRLERREGNILHIRGCDMLDGTPLLDIKPYSKRFDRVDTQRDGWQDEVNESEARIRGRRGWTGSDKQTASLCPAEPAPDAGTALHADGPQGELLLRTLPRAGDLGFNDTVFGGWLMAQMDLAGSILAKDVARTRTAMVAADGLRFLKSLQVGDVLSCYGRVLRMGRTSLTIRLELWAMPVLPERPDAFQEYKACEANITYVSLGPDGKKQEIQRKPAV